MKPLRKHSRLWAALSVMLLAGLACNLGQPQDDPDIVPTVAAREPTPESTAVGGGEVEGPTDVPGLSRAERANLIAATVQVLALFEEGGELVPYWTGSGTIIDESGLILTNAHVAAPAAFADAYGEQDVDPDALAVAITESEDRPPVPTYLAEVRAADGFLDLTVIQITATLDGDSIEPSDLNLPHVPLGDSEQVHAGDPLFVIGFPGIGGDTVTFTSGNVAGFSSEEPVGDRAWIKTDATIAGGNSGGLAASDEARIIGVPSKLGAGGYQDVNAPTDCRRIQDTNGDGTIDESDNCIPTGGFINAIRPINFAEPLIDAAINNLAYESPYAVPGAGGQVVPGTGSEAFGPITWYTVDEDGNFQDPVTSYPSGTGVLVAAFEFSGMADGEEWGEIWYQDGQEVYSDTYLWDQGEAGSYYTYLSNSGDPMPDGEYTVELYAGPGLPLLSQGMVAVAGGGGFQPGPQEGVILYGTINDGDAGRPIRGATIAVLLPGVTYDAWSGSGDEVYTFAESDRSGQYELPDPLAFDVGYTVVVFADGYRTKYGDDLVWTAEEGDLYEFNVDLVK